MAKGDRRGNGSKRVAVLHKRNAAISKTTKTTKKSAKVISQSRSGGAR